MFDFEKALESWRATLPPHMREHGERVDELGQHLRDAFDGRVAAGDAPEAAWATAVASLGPAKGIEKEFRKLDRRPWLPARLAGAVMVSIILAMAAIVGVRLRGQPLLAVHVLLVTTAYCAVFAVGFLATLATLIRAWSGWEGRQSAFEIAARRIAALSFLTVVPAVLLGAIWAHEHLGRWWGWDTKEIGGLCVLAWSGILLRSFSGPTPQPQLLMLAGIFGNIVVSISWFGPVLTNSGHAYGNAPSVVGALLSGFLILQMGLVYLAMLPERALRVNRFGGRAQ